jgi:hypothetical protein
MTSLCFLCFVLKSLQYEIFDEKENELFTLSEVIHGRYFDALVARKDKCAGYCWRQNSDVWLCADAIENTTCVVITVNNTFVVTNASAPRITFRITLADNRHRSLQQVPFKFPAIQNYAVEKKTIVFRAHREAFALANELPNQVWLMKMMEAFTYGIQDVLNKVILLPSLPPTLLPLSLSPSLLPSSTPPLSLSR